MKRLLSTLLCLALLFGALSVGLTVGAAPPSTWHASTKEFKLTAAPEIVRITESSDENGTEARAFFVHSAEVQKLEELRHAAFDGDGRLVADMLGRDEKDVEANLEIGVQFAYSFDGVNWVNDWAPEYDLEDPYYAPTTDFDLNGDDLEEYRNLPTKNVNLSYLYDDIALFNGAESGVYTAAYCYPPEGMTVRDVLTKRNEALLQGRGEYLGSSYDPDADDAWKGFAIDFSANTLYVKARYRVFSWVHTREDGVWTDTGSRVTYSPWGEVKTFNNANRTPEGQNAAPEINALRTSAAPVLEALSSKREKRERDGVEVKTTCYQLAFRYPEATRTALARFYALDRYEEREKYTDEVYEPDIVWEVRVGSGDWFFLDCTDYNDPYYKFDDDFYGTRDKLEALGYKAGDPVFVRATLFGSYTYNTERDDATGVDKVVPDEGRFIYTAPSNVVELSLAGKWNVTYELNGGAFPYGTTQVSQFDEDTDVTVDLTAPDYTPARANFVFRGWYSSPDLAESSKVTSFDTKTKVSKTFYAKWEELPHYAVTYDFGVITGYVFNPNPDAVYSDDGEIELNPVSYSGATFLGWYTEKTGGNKVTALSYASMAGDLTLYAHWDLPTYTITYAGAGTDYVNDPRNPSTFQIDPSGESVVRLYAPKKTGWIFDGWFLNADLKSGELSYDQNGGFWCLDEGRNGTLYAKFIVGRWKINYVLNLEGVWNGNPETHTYGTAVELQDPTRTGYVFGGWYSDKGLTKKVTVIADDVEGEVTLYAKWTPITYQIKYDLRSAEPFFSNPNPATRGVDDEVKLQPLVPKDAHYRFIGWFDNVNLDGKPVEVIHAGTDRDVTLYAGFIRYRWGDVDFDGLVTAADARLVLRRAVELEEFEAAQNAWGDLDMDGLITAADARLALRMAVELVSEQILKLPEFPPDFKG